MSTEINIRKRIDIQEEGVSITPDVNSINFTGAGVTASAVGQDVTVDITAAAGSILYYMNQTVAQAPYQEFSSTGTTAAEQIVPATVAGGATVTIAAFQTPSGVPNTIVIPQGLWQFFLHFNATTAGQNWIIRPLVYKRDLGGTETLLFSIDPITVTNMSTVTTLYTTGSVVPNTVLLTTDRLVVKIDMQNTTGVSQTVNFRTEGSQHYSIVTTTLNQAVPTGAVTSVTGTAPVVSSGGTAPAISMPQANGTTDGYLDSADWTNFNNKVDDNIYTADGTVVGTRTVDLDGNTINFNDGKLGVNVTPGFSLQVRGTAIPSAGETVARFDVSDSSAYLSVVNGTSTNGAFAPMIQGRQIGTSTQSALVTEGIIDVADDTGTAPVTLFKTRLTGLLQVVTRPVFRFSNWTLDIMTMLANGNVGIGTTTPTEKLEVSGKTKTTTFQMTTTPTAGYVLTSDASGNGSWQANGNGTVTSVGLTAGTGISLAGTNPITSSGSITVTNSAPDQTVVLNNGAGIGVSGTYPNFTVTNTDTGSAVTLGSAGGTESLVNDGTGPALATKGVTAGTGISLSSTSTALTVTNSAPDQVVSLTPSTGINVTGAYPSFTIVNTAPDQTVALTAGTGIGVTGTYPNFTIDNTSPDTSGKIGIANSSGVFTYYSTLAAACAAAVSGQTITLFTDVTETTATAAILPDGVDLNLNGNSYILDVAGITNAIETAGGGSSNIIYNGKIIRRNVGGSSFLIGLCLRNRNAVLNLYGVDLINEDNCTALLIEESGTVDGSWSARCVGTASGVTVASGYTPLVSNGTITSGDIGVYIDSGSTINLYNSYIASSNSAIWSVGIGVELNNSTVLASANTAIEIASGTVIIDRSFIAAGSGGAINASSGTVDISLSRIASVGADAISIGTIVGNLKIVGSHITTLNGTNNFSIENLQAYKVDISNNYFFIQGTGTRRNLSFANTSDAGNAILDIKNNTLEVVSSGIAGAASNIHFGNYTSGFYKVSGNELRCSSSSAAARCIRTNGFSLTMAYISNVLRLTNGQNPIDLNITQGNGFTPDLYGNIQTDY